MATETQVTRTTTNVDDRSDVHDSDVDAPDTVSVMTRIVYIAFAVITGILLIRFVMSLGGANRANAFADFIYTVSAPLVAPFRGLFNIDTTIGGVSRFEYEVLIAILVYGLIAQLAIMLVRLPRRA